MSKLYEWIPATEKNLPKGDATYKWPVPSGGFGTGLLPRWQAEDFLEDCSEMWILREVDPVVWPGEDAIAISCAHVSDDPTEQTMYSCGYTDGIEYAENWVKQQMDK